MVFWVSLAVCIAFLAVISEVDQHVDVEEMKDSGKEESMGDVSDIVSIEVQAVPKDWYSGAENGGFVVYITFYDEHGNTIEFKDTEYTVRIKIFNAETDSRGNVVKGELLFDFCCPPIKKTSSSDVSEPNGIEIYLNPSKYTGEGIIEVEVEIPGVGTFYAAGEAVPLSL